MEYLMSDNDKLIAEVRELFDESWCICRRADLGERVLAALEVSRVPTPAEDREPQPTDGPDFHAEHAAWASRTPTETAEHNCSDPRAGSLRLDDRGCCFWCGEAVTPVTPAEGEAEDREALARAIFVYAVGDEGGAAWDSPGSAGRARWYGYADAILDAGFSRRSLVETEDNWEYAVRGRTGRVRRRPAGPWLPEEKK